jgi:hypothetical protein
MRVLGYITTVVIAIIIVGGVVVLLMSIPDIKRYLSIRKM